MTIISGKSFAALIAVAMVIGLGTSTPTHAALVLDLSDTTGASASIADNEVNPPTEVDLASGVTGTIIFIDDFGAFTDGTRSGLTVTTRSSAGTGTIPAQVRQTTITLRNNTATAQTLTIKATDDAFTAPPAGEAVASQSLSIDAVGFEAGNFGAGGGSASFVVESVINGTSIGTVSLSGPGASPVDTGVVTLSSPYTIMQTIMITLGGGGEVNLTATTEVGNVVPEPTTLAAAFTALPLLGGFYLRRRMKRAV